MALCALLAYIIYHDRKMETIKTVVVLTLLLSSPFLSHAPASFLPNSPALQESIFHITTTCQCIQTNHFSTMYTPFELSCQGALSAEE